MSRTTDDLFDSFRNLHLALESILDHIAPQVSGEPEGKWLRRALTEAHARINLSRFTSRAHDPVGDVYQDLYINTRNRLFHAKGSRTRYLPQDAAAEKGAVAAAVTHLSRLYIALAAKEFNARGIGSYIYPPMFDELREGIKGAIRLHVTEAPVAEGTEMGASGRVLALSTRHVPDFDAPFYCGILGTVEYPGSRQVSALVSTLNGGPYSFGELEGVLALEDLARLEGYLGIRMANASMPKLHFVT